MKDKEETAYIRCVAFGKMAEFAESYFYKGIKIAVSGHLVTGSYKNETGTTVYTTDVVVEKQEFAESRKNKSGTVQAAA
jgi:single-strand DNA-binding protein